MRERPAAYLFACLFALFIARAAGAETYGPISIVVQPSLTPAYASHYHEYRFAIENTSPDPHVVRLSIEGEGRRGNTSRVTRTIQAAPRSQSVVAVPHLVTDWSTASRVVVTIDDKKQDTPIQLAEETSFDAREEANVLLSRSVRAAAPAALLDLSRPDIPPSAWSSSWLQYGRFSGVIVTASDWRELPPGVRQALLRWAFAGGTLMLSGDADPLAGLPRNDTGAHGLGAIVFVEASAGGSIDERVIATALQEHATPGAFTERAADELQLVDPGSFPLRSLFGVLCLFAIVAGPVNLFVLAKRNRRVRVFWTMPLLALGASFILVGATFATEGLVRIARAKSVTYLDEQRGEAVTLGLAGFYSTVSRRGAVRFDAATELRPVQAYVSGADTAWDDGQRLFGSWVGTRVPSLFTFRKVESRRERLPLRRDGGTIKGVNGLGGAIESLWVADENGEIFVASEIGPGAAFTLTRSADRRTAGDGGAPGGSPFPRETWQKVFDSATADPATMLRPGMYVAKLNDSPFVERAMERATASSSEAVVIGLSRDGGDDAG